MYFHAPEVNATGACPCEHVSDDLARDICGLWEVGAGHHHQHRQPMHNASVDVEPGTLHVVQ
eukprot:2968660-Heterocapsa_arctica.AAC.1